MVSEQLQSMGVSRLDRIMKEINRNHELVISMMTEIIEAKSTSRDESNYYNSSEMQMDDSKLEGNWGSCSESEEKLVKQFSSYDFNGGNDLVVETETLVESSFEKLEFDLGVENDEENFTAENVIVLGSDYKQLLPKTDFPLFEGEGPREWLRKAMKYFQLHQTPDELKLGVAKMHLEGKAYVWFYVFTANHPGADWSLFSDELCRRFSETTGEEVVETFSKIKQLGTMKEHQESEESEPEEGQGSEEVMEISVSALAGSLKHKNIRVPGMIKGRKISILIDSKSAHSFVDERLIKELNYATNEANVMTIRVANGDKIESKAVCQPLVWREKLDQLYKSLSQSCRVDLHGYKQSADQFEGLLGKFLLMRMEISS